MRHLNLIIFILSTLLLDVVFAQIGCYIITRRSGKLALGARAIRGRESRRCWAFPVPAGDTARFNVTKLTSDRTDGVTVHLSINEVEIRPQILGSNNRVISQKKDVVVTHYVRNSFSFYPVNSFFEFTYLIGPGEITVVGVDEARARMISWLKNQRLSNGGWGEDTPKAIIALHLATKTNFNSGDPEEETMASALEREILQRLVKASDTAAYPIEDLIDFNNALVAACLDPVDFGNPTLLAALKTNAEKDDNPKKGESYLALCNAGEALPEKVATTLLDDLKDADPEKQAFAIMAFACEKTRNSSLEDTYETAVAKAIRNIKRKQRRDGNFGSVDETILFTQALLSWGERDAKGWDFAKSVQYLMQQQSDETKYEFEKVHNILPIFSGKSVANVSCSEAYFGDNADNKTAEYYDAAKTSHKNNKISLHFEDKSTHSMSLTLPHGAAAISLLKSAAVYDPKFRFQVKQDFKTQVSEIAGVKNDPDGKKNWQPYIKSWHGTTSLKEDLGQYVMQDGEELILRYKAPEKKSLKNLLNLTKKTGDNPRQ